MSRKAEELDRHIGLRLKMRRILCGMSQDDLAQKLGITFQQIQKYEKAMNRVSASRLYEIGNILGVHCEYFREGYNEDAALFVSEKGISEQDYLSSLPKKKNYTDNELLSRLMNMPHGDAKQRIMKNLEKELNALMQDG